MYLYICVKNLRFLPTKPHGMSSADWKAEKARLLAISNPKAKHEEFEAANAAALAASKNKNIAIKRLPSNSSIQETEYKKTFHNSGIE